MAAIGCIVWQTDVPFERGVSVELRTRAQPQRVLQPRPGRVIGAVAHADVHVRCEKRPAEQSCAQDLSEKDHVDDGR